MEDRSTIYSNTGYLVDSFDTEFDRGNFDSEVYGANPWPAVMGMALTNDVSSISGCFRNEEAFSEARDVVKTLNWYTSVG
jgi:hypothetical protein